MQTENHIERAVEILGSQKKLADAVGCSQQHISLLIRGGVKTTAEMAIKIDRATDGKVARGEIRPDIFGPPLTADRFDAIIEKSEPAQ